MVNRTSHISARGEARAGSDRHLAVMKSERTLEGATTLGN